METVGYLTIEKIGLKNEVIKEGTKDEILKNNLGHFSATPKYNGNVCIAGHNYSIKSSRLFKDLNNLDTNDKIIYKCDGFAREYKVKSKKEIKSSDINVLDNTSENMLTLITCTNSKEDTRLCIKATEIKEE